MMRLPGIQRIGWLQYRAIALHSLDFRIQRADDAGCYLAQNGERVVERSLIRFGPDDSAVVGGAQLHCDEKLGAVVSNRAGRRVVDVERTTDIARIRDLIAEGKRTP